MIQHRSIAPEAIDLELDARAANEVGRIAAQNPSDVNDRAFSLARVGHFEKRARCRLDHAAVSDLAATLGIEDCLGDDGCNLITCFAAGREHFGLDLVSVVADESRRSASAQADLRCGCVILACGASALLLLAHQ